MLHGVDTDSVLEDVSSPPIFPKLNLELLRAAYKGSPVLPVGSQSCFPQSSARWQPSVAFAKFCPLAAVSCFRKVLPVGSRRLLKAKFCPLAAEGCFQQSSARWQPTYFPAFNQSSCSQQLMKRIFPIAMPLAKFRSPLAPLPVRTAPAASRDRGQPFPQTFIVSDVRFPTNLPSLPNNGLGADMI